ncbi:hypothetical protein PV10_05727 [Exophiala mesophila]|uniref:Uncharacterized protein n=1 Tax=Exophiala mesophila TaxID=212818 RepID=A0A0D1WQ28_EXOME|nr:uncharacterized protein PV10_05727 [Exophiala mesophila]KIV91155.1 hypothetical protein PV10_05727 [Exophiala mesophila]
MTQSKKLVIFASSWNYLEKNKSNMSPTDAAHKAHSKISTSDTQPVSKPQPLPTIRPDPLSPRSIQQVPKQTKHLDFDRLQKCVSPSLHSDPEALSLWYILTTSLLLSFHKEKLVADLWRYIIRTVTNTNDQLAVARCIREACLKSSTLVGFPRAINALIALKTAIDTSTPQLSSILSSDQSLRSPISSAQKSSRGMQFFRQIYKQHTGRVLAAMDETSGGDLTYFAINCIYGELLADHSIVGARDTGLLEFVCCLADDCAPQAKGHFFGSINLGASNDILRSSILLTADMAFQLGLDSPWEANREEYRFLDRVLV